MTDPSQVLPKFRTKKTTAKQAAARSAEEPILTHFHVLEPEHAHRRCAHDGVALL
jgi:hypothetical protein